jgi:hypothetical protein
MVPPFDIFERQAGGSARWVGIAVDLEAATQRIKELAESEPGQYFIFSLATGHRLDVKAESLANRSHGMRERSARGLNPCPKQL